MKRFNVYVCLLAVLAPAFVSCEKMLEVESNRYLMAKDNKLDNPNDSLYSIAGILNKLQTLGDDYVILGELRADMMDVTHNADINLREVSELMNLSEDSYWNNVNDYYVVINHCNYLIQNMDTSVMVNGAKPLTEDWAAAKAIRAWVYMQLALNYGEAYYFVSPILTIEDVSKTRTKLNRSELFDQLILDLKDIEGIKMPDYGSMGGVQSSLVFPSVNYMLGELYLWQNEYENAARVFYQDIFDNRRTVNSTTASYVTSETDAYDTYFSITDKWSTSLQANTAGGDVIFAIPYYYSSLYGHFEQCPLYRLTYADYKLFPSERAVDWFESQTYTGYNRRGGGSTDNDDTSEDEGIQEGSNDNSIVEFSGDLRGRWGSYGRLSGQIVINGVGSSSAVTDNSDELLDEEFQITKEPDGSPYIRIYSSDIIYVQRASVEYLRFAEAVNRYGCPSLALAVINYGLSNNILADSTKVNPSELGQDFTDWSSDRFSRNIGTRSRGQGVAKPVSLEDYAELDTIPTRADSIKWVEKLILEECAFESAFEGTRFQDLMRFTLHEPSANYIGKAIGLKHGEAESDETGAYHLWLKDQKNWYLPYPDYE